MSRMTVHRLRHSGIETAYHDTGEGPVLLMLHGFTGSKLDFHDQAAWFSDRYRVILPDNRGHGESTNTISLAGYDLDTLAADLHGFIEALGLRDIHLLGHSMGGMVAMRYALAHGDNLKSLILMDTAAREIDLIEGYGDMMVNAIQDRGVHALVESMMAATVEQEVQNGIDYLGSDEHWARIEEKLEQMDLMAFLGLSASFDSMPDLTSQLAGVNCPATVMVGAVDVPFLPSSREMAETLPKGTLQVIPDAAHCPQYENADAWRQVIEHHLSSAS